MDSAQGWAGSDGEEPGRQPVSHPDRSGTFSGQLVQEPSSALVKHRGPGQIADREGADSVELSPPVDDITRPVRNRNSPVTAGAVCVGRQLATHTSKWIARRTSYSFHSPSSASSMKSMVINLGEWKARQESTY